MALSQSYFGTRNVILCSNTHLVEIDLLRGGERMPVEGLAPCDYVVMVRRSYERPRIGLWPLSLRDPLPTIPVPLRIGDSDATIDLERLLHEQYDATGYEDYVYRGRPQPGLTESEAAWAESIVKGNVLPS